MIIVKYTLSPIKPNKVGSGFHINAAPDGYAPTLTVDFVSENEAEDWVAGESSAWLRKLETQRNGNLPL